MRVWILVEITSKTREIYITCYKTKRLVEKALANLSKLSKGYIGNIPVKSK